MANDFKNSKNSGALVDLAPELIGTVPPQAVELEEAVLGALMLESDKITEVQEYLTESSFYKEEHRLIYRVMNELALAQQPIDLFTVTNQLKSKRELKKVGGASYLAQLTQRVGTAANIEFHSRIITQKHIQRELIRASTEIQRQSYDSTIDVNDLIGFAEGEVLKITEGYVKRSVQTASDILRATIRQIEKAAENDSRYSGVCTGFTDLDNVTLGWQPSDLIIIAARPAMGKTAFTLTMARNMAVDYDAAVAFFSLEMSSVQLMTRLVCAETGISGQTIRSGKLTPSEWKTLETNTQSLGMAPLYIDDTPALSIFEFRSKVRRLKANNDIKIIMVDYLQLMTAAGKGDKGNREQEVAFISRSLKGIAKELNVPIIALSQLSDLRESGAIEQDADLVAFIHRPEYYGFTGEAGDGPVEGLAEFILAKHRNGSVGDIKLRFIKEQAKFTNWDQIVSSGAPAPSFDQFEEVEAFGGSPMSSLQNATGSEFDISRVSTPVPASSEEAPF